MFKSLVFVGHPTLRGCFKSLLSDVLAQNLGRRHQYSTKSFDLSSSPTSGIVTIEKINATYLILMQSQCERSRLGVSSTEVAFSIDTHTKP